MEHTARQWLSKRNIITEYGVSLPFIDAMIRDGRLPAYKMGGKAVRIRRTDVEALLVPIEAQA